jgi:hypothetical protein
MKMRISPVIMQTPSEHFLPARKVFLPVQTLLTRRAHLQESIGPECDVIVIFSRIFCGIYHSG